MRRTRARCCLLLGTLSFSTAFICPIPGAGGGARCASSSRRTRVSHVPSCAGALPFLARHAGVSAATSSSSSGAGLPMSMSMTDVWLAADVGAPPGDAYLATGLFGIAAAVIAVGTGYLVLSVVSGENGLGSFLGKEKGQNPFYKDDFSQMAPKPPEFLNKIRLLDLDFVEVYNQPPRPEEFEDGGSGSDPSIDALLGGKAQDTNVVATAESLRQRLLEAVQAKDYALASTLERELASFMRKNGMSFEDDSDET